MDSLEYLQEQEAAAIQRGDFEIAQQYHALYKVRELEVKKQFDAMMSPNYIHPMSYANVDLENIIAKPGSIVTFSRYDGTQDVWGDEEAIKAFAESKEKDKRRNLKIFLHFAKQFCSIYPNWQVTPDARAPFDNITITNPTTGSRIESAYPMNEVKVYGGPPTSKCSQMGLDHETVSLNDFSAWALGIDDVPMWIKEK